MENGDEKLKPILVLATEQTSREKRNNEKQLGVYSAFVGRASIDLDEIGHGKYIMRILNKSNECGSLLQSHQNQYPEGFGFRDRLGLVVEKEVKSIHQC